jgi:hypothetical protein
MVYSFKRHTAVPLTMVEIRKPPATLGPQTRVAGTKKWFTYKPSASRLKPKCAPEVTFSEPGAGSTLDPAGRVPGSAYLLAPAR